MPPLNNDSSFEVRWSLSELEDIVFDFINAHDLPPEFKVPIPGNSSNNKPNDDKAGAGGQALGLKTPSKTVRIAEGVEYVGGADGKPHHRVK